MNDENIKRDWAAHVDNMPIPFHGLMSGRTVVLSNQVKLATILIDQLKSVGVFGKLSYNDNGPFTIAIARTAFPNSTIEKIIMNFNRFNMSFILKDEKEEMDFGIFRYKTKLFEDIEATLTKGLHFNNDSDQELVEVLCVAFENTRIIYNETMTEYRELNKNEDIDLNTIAFVDLCTKYCTNLILTGKLIRLGYGTLTAMEFYKTIDLEKLKDMPGIGAKSITIIKNIYKFYGFSKWNEKQS